MTERTCYQCQFVRAWEEYGQRFTDCKLAERDVNHLTWMLACGVDTTDISDIAPRCPNFLEREENDGP